VTDPAICNECGAALADRTADTLMDHLAAEHPERPVAVDADDLSLLILAAMRYIQLSQGTAPAATDRWISEIAARVNRYGPEVGIVGFEDKGWPGVDLPDGGVQ